MWNEYTPRPINPNRYTSRPNILQASLTQLKPRETTMLMYVPYVNMTRNQALTGLNSLACVNVVRKKDQGNLVTKLDRAVATTPLEDSVLITWKYDVRAVFETSGGLIPADCSLCKARTNCILLEKPLGGRQSS